MSNYIKQYDLPCYPNSHPLPGCRTIIGLEKGSIFDENFHGFSKWMGGGGIGRIEAGYPTSEAIKDLIEQVRQRLRQRVEETYDRLEWEIRLLQRWESDPDQFTVKPEKDR